MAEQRVEAGFKLAFGESESVSTCCDLCFWSIELILTKIYNCCLGIHIARSTFDCFFNKNFVTVKNRTRNIYSNLFL